MYSLRLACTAEDVDLLSGDLWELGTMGIQELDYGDEVLLIAGFATNEYLGELMQRFASHSPEWEQADSTDWVQHTRAAWPPREVGERIFLAPPWSDGPTPAGRVRVAHNPGLACGTGEHPCTQLALMAVEQNVFSGAAVVDVGTGSGVLAITALQLGARSAVGMDRDETALHAARENFELNRLAAHLVVGSADCLRAGCSDLTIANISGTVLLGMLDELLRITAATGCVILTGFPESELAVFQRVFPGCAVTELNEWRCVVALASSLHL